MSDLVITITVLGASALAIMLLVALNAFIGGWTTARLKDVDAAAERIAVDVLGFQPGHDAVLDADRTAALVFEQDGARLGVAICRGDRMTVRALRPADIKTATANGSELVLSLDDYTLPQIMLRTGDPSISARWAEDILSFKGARDATSSDAEPA